MFYHVEIDISIGAIGRILCVNATDKLERVSGVSATDVTLPKFTSVFRGAWDLGHDRAPKRGDDWVSSYCKSLSNGVVRCGSLAKAALGRLSYPWDWVGA